MSYTIKFKEGTEKVFDSLRSANLRGANLSGTDLSDADLRGADLRRADLRGVDLIGADLRSADLNYADLRSADLSDANLRGADLRRADLSDADLRSAKGVISFNLDREVLIYHKFEETCYINIGCERHTLEHWLTHYKEIGKKNSYSDDEIEVYGMFIKLCNKLEIK